MTMRYLLSMGSNVADKPEKLEEAMSRLAASEILAVRKATEFYETPDMAGGERRYLNAVVEIESELKAEDLDKAFKAMEVEMGRDMKARRRGDVPIDLDIVTCGGEILRPKDYSAQFFRQGMSLLDANNKKLL